MPAKEYVGLTGPEYEVDIERGKIREFARAMNAPLAEFVDGRCPIIPATYLVSAPYTWGYTLERPRGTVFGSIDHDLSVPLHAEEAFVFHGPPPHAGDRLTARSMLENVREKAGASGGALTFLTVLTEYRNASGVLVVEQRSTTVTTGNSPGDGDWTATVPPYEPHYDSLDPVDPFSAISRAAWDDLLAGQGPGPVDAGPLLLRDIVRFQGVVGEDNPLHHDVSWAHSCNYPNVFGLGTHQASVLAGYLAHWIDPETVRSFQVRFRNVYWPGDPIVYDGKVIEKHEQSETLNRRADFELSCMRGSGDVLVQAWATCDFRSGEG